MKDTEHKNILGLYGAMAASVFLQCVPWPFLQLAGLALMLGALLRAAQLRRASAPDSLTASHMTFLLRTVWMSGLFLILGFAGASAWFYAVGDHTLIHTAVDRILAGQIPREEEVVALLRDYKDANLRLLILASVFAAGPAVLYFLYRTARGVARAAAGHRIAQPKALL